MADIIDAVEGQPAIFAGGGGKCIEVLRDCGFGVGYTELHSAAELGNRAKVDELLANGRRQVHQQTLIPDSGYHVLNRRIGERPNPFLTSKLNPLEATELTKGYDPRAREWTGRQGLVGLPKEQTSFWCESFGMSSSDKAIDQDFKHAMEPKGDPQAAAGLHSRAWRV